MAVKEEKGEQVVENVEVALEKTGDFFEKHKSVIITVVTVIVLLVIGYFGYKYLYLAPKEKTAAQEMFYSQRYFEMDSMQNSLNGDGQHPGFLEIADTYGATKSGKLAHYYSGLIYLHQGNFQEAVAHIEKFKTKDPVLYILSRQALGDAYWELGQTDQALATYKQGAEKYDNEMLCPTVMSRMAALYESLQQYDNAIKVYEELRSLYPRSMEARNVDMMIARLQAKAGK